MNSVRRIFAKVILVIVLVIPVNAYADWTEKSSMLLDEWVNRPLEELIDVWEMGELPFLAIPGFGPPSGNVGVQTSTCKIRFEFQEGRVTHWHVHDWTKSCEQLITKDRRPRQLQGTPLPWE
jgi:hypothetical protein